MKNLKIAAIASLLAVALSTSSFASGLFVIPTVLTIDEYAAQSGRTEEEILAEVAKAARAELGLDEDAVYVPVTPVVPETPEVEEDDDDGFIGVVPGSGSKTRIPSIFAK